MYIISRLTFPYIEYRIYFLKKNVNLRKKQKIRAFFDIRYAARNPENDTENLFGAVPVFYKSHYSTILKCPSILKNAAQFFVSVPVFYNFGAANIYYRHANIIDIGRKENNKRFFPPNFMS